MLKSKHVERNTISKKYQTETHKSLPSGQSPLLLKPSDDLKHLSYKPVFGENPNLIFIIIEKFPNLLSLNTQKVNEETKMSAQFINLEIPKILIPLLITLQEMEDRAKKDYFRLCVKYELKIKFGAKIGADDNDFFNLESNSLHGDLSLKKLIQWSKKTSAILGYDFKTEDKRRQRKISPGIHKKCPKFQKLDANTLKSSSRSRSKSSTSQTRVKMEWLWWGIETQNMFYSLGQMIDL